MPTTATLSAVEARWLAIAAQGLGKDRPRRRAGPRELRGVIDTIGIVQLDAINVLERTQFVVLFSRLGSYDTGLLHELTGPGGELHECNAHAASLVRVEHEPLFRFRAELARAYGDSPTYAPRWEAFHKAHADYMDSLMVEIRERGPLAASQLSDPRRNPGEWWDRRSLGRRCLEFLYMRGELSAWRTPTFERVYDLPEHVIPAEILAAPPVPAEEAQRAFVLLSAMSLGVATAADLADYFRVKPQLAKLRIAELEEDGRLLRLEVEGWREPGFALPGTRPAALQREHATLLSPFDSLIWNRQRTLRLFGFDYRIEVYVPEPKRVFGYYVLPLLVGDQLVARFDLKADRKASVLRVVASHVEPGVDQAAIAAPAIAELEAMRSWLGLDAVVVQRRGNLAGSLARAGQGRP
jgi:uncharacterized protein